MGKIAGSNPAGTTDGWCLGCSGMAYDAVNVEAAGSIPLGHPFAKDESRRIKDESGVDFILLHASEKECAPGRAGGLQSRSTGFKSLRSCSLPMWLDLERQRSRKPPHAGANPAVGS